MVNRRTWLVAARVSARVAARVSAGLAAGVSAGLATALAAPAPAPAVLALDNTHCVAPAKAGGGFDLTCQLAQQGLAAGRHLAAPMRISYLPGGIGAVAYDQVVRERPADAQTVVAFSSGSLLNLAQGKFGRHSEQDVRWLAGLALDHGVVVVAQQSPFHRLQDLMAALKANPARVAFGAGGTVGSQDWVKAALTARAAGVHHRDMRFVAFEGGGEALTALQGGHVQVCTGDASETAARIAAGAPLRVLAVMAPQRLPGRLAQVPTAREAGADLVWPTMRGVYLGPQVSDADHRAWTELFNRLLASPAFERLRRDSGLSPFALTGPELAVHVGQQVQAYRQLAAEFGLPTKPPPPARPTGWPVNTATPNPTPTPR